MDNHLEGSLITKQANYGFRKEFEKEDEEKARPCTYCTIAYSEC